MPVDISAEPAPRVRAASALRAALRALCEPYYIDPDAVLESSLQRADRVWLARDSTDTVEGFFCVSTHGFSDEATGVQRLEYGGLAVAALPRRAHGLTARLLRAWRDDIAVRRDDEAPPLVCGITCHHFLLQTARSLFVDVQPNEDGGHDAEGARLAGLVQERLFDRTADPERPFRLAGITPTRYREDFLEQVPVARRLQAWDIDERQGDRLLILCRCG